MPRRISAFFTALLLSLCGCADDYKLVQKQHQEGLFEIRLVVRGEPNTAYKEMKVDSTGERLLLAHPAILDIRDVHSAKKELDRWGSSYCVRLRLRDYAAGRFAEFTRKHVGERVALIVDNKIVVAPEITVEIPDGSFAIYGKFSEKRADEVLSKLTGKEKES